MYSHMVERTDTHTHISETHGNLPTCGNVSMRFIHAIQPLTFRDLPIEARHQSQSDVMRWSKVKH